MKVVIDSNVLISGLLNRPNSPPRKIFEFIKNRSIDIIVSATLLKEIIAVTNRGNFRGLIEDNEKRDFIKFIKARVTRIKTDKRFNICRDTKDNHLLNAVVSGDGAYLVTGDGDLLALKSIENIPIVSPMNFLHIIEKR